MIRQQALAVQESMRAKSEGAFARESLTEGLRVLLVSPDPLPVQRQLKELSFDTLAVWGDQTDIKNMLRLQRPHLIVVDMMGTPGELLTQWLRRTCDQPVICCLNQDQAQTALDDDNPESLNFVVHPIRPWDLKINIELALMFDMAHNTRLTLDTARRCAKQPYEPVMAPRIGSPRLTAVANPC